MDSTESHPADDASDRLTTDLSDGKAGSPFDLAVVLADLRDRAPARRKPKDTTPAS